MKIKISEYSSYSIDVPEEMDSKQLDSFIHELHIVRKMLRRDPMNTDDDDEAEDTKESTPSTYSGRKSHLSSVGREEALAFVRRCKQGGVHEREKMAKELGVSIATINWRMKKYIDEFKIKKRDYK